MFVSFVNEERALLSEMSAQMWWCGMWGEGLGARREPKDAAAL